MSPEPSRLRGDHPALEIGQITMMKVLGPAKQEHGANNYMGFESYVVDKNQSLTTKPRSIITCFSISLSCKAAGLPVLCINPPNVTLGTARS